VEDVVEPARQEGRHVICDRYDSSTYAFQIWGEERQELNGLFDAVRGSLEPGKYYPDLYIFLDLPSEVAYARRSADASQEKSKFDVRPVAYHERTRQGFNSFAKKYGPARLVNAEHPPEEVHRDIWELISRELGL
jgi:dTMP kinase